ncbi:Insulin receptor-related protein [Trichinella pseudospiralis]|uniref:Insulin receptor-related protein n=1 Tax=Trichinella pseudospiralis TaxID=6337 RepID=A0A0V0XSL8_TRIPS|nr:Insulin receptor-related protein [Trichinella pseudospiralis]
MNNLKNINEEDYVRWNYDKGVEDTSYEAENYFNMDETWAPKTTLYKEYLTIYRTKRNSIKEFYRNVLCNETFFHGYLPLQDAREILKHQPSGHFVVHITNKCGFLNPVVLFVKHYAEVAHHAMNVAHWGLFDSVLQIIAHHVESGEYIDDKINFKLITPADFCDWQIRTENVLTIKKDIGLGCFSNVSFGFHFDKGKFIEAALKCPKEIAEVDTVEMIYTEHRILQQLDCPYIIKPFDLIHRDIAARNCSVFKSSDKITAKLSDFNLCKEIYEEEKESPCISLRWSAPESLGECMWSFESDLWMFGVLMWELFTNALYPHDKNIFESTEDFWSYLMEGNTLEMLPEIPVAIQTIILRLNSINPAKRAELGPVGMS